MSFDELEAEFDKVENELDELEKLATEKQRRLCLPYMTFAKTRPPIFRRSFF